MQQNISLQHTLENRADRSSVDVARLLEASIAPNTAKAYGDALRKLFEYLDGQPLTDTTLAGYLAHLYTRGLAPASVTVVVQAIRFWEKLDRRSSSVGPLTSRTLAGIRREGRNRGRG
ncbi:MAG: hypothetical protein F4Z29_10670, partial [Gemmatimonadetes bacterium]|nr:hypothetical protein [Gemmatimonadota bacterium]